MNVLGFLVEITPDNKGTLLVTCPALPEIETYAIDEEDAFFRAADAIMDALSAREAELQQPKS